MLCQNCGKTQANTMIKTMLNGHLSECALCSECAKKMGYENIFSNFDFNFSGLFKNLLYQNSRNDLICSNCGKNIETITSDGKIGCADCYENFYDILMPLIEKLHNSLEHKGKSPSKPALMLNTNNSHELTIINQSEIDLKRSLLKIAVDEQRFEDAVILRDEIKEMEEKNPYDNK